MFWFWLIIAVILGIGELMTVEFLMLWFAVGALAAALTAKLFPFIYQLAVFVFLSFILIILSRKLILRKGGHRTNILALIGKEVLVIETVQRIYCDRGLVKVNGEIWRAYCDVGEIQAGNMVTILEVNGTKLKVKPVSEK